MPEPTTAAGKRLLEREALNSRSFTLIRPEDIAAIEAEAHAAGAAEALRRVEAAVAALPVSGSVMGTYYSREQVLAAIREAGTP